ncbi:MAG: cytosolic protein [Planctomycetes bacterium]|nr:cytosolic protein [Planctomycetota bacterium]
MGKVMESEIRGYIEENIPDFHRRRLESLGGLRLKLVLSRKNPYLFRAKNIQTASEMVRAILDAYLSSQEEAVFGDFLEGLAIFICGRVYGGRKSAAVGVDLEFEKSGALYIVSIKSGPNWGNASQVRKMKENFRTARQIMAGHARRRRLAVEAVNGCCYGRERAEQKDEYTKLCGQRFWEFISGSDTLYTDIIEPLGHRAKERNDEFACEYAKVVNRFTAEFITEFCHADGRILWDRVVAFNSASMLAT